MIYADELQLFYGGSVERQFLSDLIKPSGGIERGGALG
jgi:hypothetical protein